MRTPLSRTMRHPAACVLSLCVAMASAPALLWPGARAQSLADELGVSADANGRVLNGSSQRRTKNLLWGATHGLPASDR